MKAWDRRKTESESAWAAFAAYRDLGLKRTIPAAMTVAGKPPGQGRAWERWSSEHEWVSRVTAWDAHLDALAQAKMEETRGRLAKRHIEIADALIGASLQGLEQYIGPKATGKLKGSEVASLMKLGLDTQALRSGMDTEQVRHTGGLTIDSLRAARKARTSHPPPQPDRPALPLANASHAEDQSPAATSTAPPSRGAETA